MLGSSLAPDSLAAGSSCAAESGAARRSAADRRSAGAIDSWKSLQRIIRVNTTAPIAAINMVFCQSILVAAIRRVSRSEEHTSELQSRGHLVCRLLLEKKKKIR